MPQGNPGYNAAVYATGTSTLMTLEPCSVVSGDLYEVTDSARRILDAFPVPIVNDSGGVVPAAEYTIGYNFGTINFNVSPTPPVTITANFLPRHLLDFIQATELSMSWEERDSTVLGNSGEDQTLTIMRVALSLDTLDAMDDDIDDGGGTLTLSDIFEGVDHVIIEFQPRGPTEDVYRARTQAQNVVINPNGPDGLLVASMQFEGSIETGANQLWSKGAP